LEGYKILDRYKESISLVKKELEEYGIKSIDRFLDGIKYNRMTKCNEYKFTGLANGNYF
jgi:hypothetical protein